MGQRRRVGVAWWCGLAVMCLGGPSALAEPDASATLPWDGLPSEPAKQRGFLRQEVIGGRLMVRRNVAEARRRALTGVLAGEVALREAFPSRTLDDLLTPLTLDAALFAVDQRGVRRAAEQAAGWPPVSDRRALAELQAAWNETVASEEAADGLERQVLFKLRALTAATPSLHVDDVRAARAALDARRATLGGGDEPVTPDRLRQVAAVDALSAAWQDGVEGILTRLLGGGSSDVPLEVPMAHLRAGDTGALGEDSRTLLAFVRPWLSAPQQEEVDTAVVAWLTGPARDARSQRLAALQDAAASAEVDGAASLGEGELAALREELSAIDAALAEPTDETPFGLATREDQTLQRDVLAATIQSAERQLATALAKRDQLALERAERERAEAEAEKDRALAAQLDAAPHPSVALRTESRNWTFEARRLLEESITARQKTAEARATRVAALADRAEVAVEDGPFVPDGAETFDGVYADLRVLNREVLDEVRAGPASLPDVLVGLQSLDPATARLAKLDAMSAAVADEPDPAAAAAAIDEARQALTAEADARQTAAEFIRAEYETLLMDLRRIQRLRHNLRDDVSAKQQTIDSRHFLQSAARELNTLRPQSRALLQDRRVLAADLTASLLDWHQLQALFRRVLWLLMGIVMWWAVRARPSFWIERVLRQLDVSLDGEDASANVTRLSRPLLDAALAWMLYGPATALAPEIGILIMSCGLGALLSAAIELLDIVVSPTSGEHEALMTVSDVAFARMRRTIEVLGIWIICSSLVNTALHEIFFVDALAAAASGVGWMVSAGIAVVLLLWWEPMMAARLRRMGQAPAWVEGWLERPDRRLSAPIRAAILGGYLTAAAVWDVLQGGLARRDGANAMVALLDRARFTEDQEAGELLDLTTRRKLYAGTVPPELETRREKAEETVVRHYDAWLEERRLGTLILTGDRGDGHYVFSKRIQPLLSVNGRPAREVTLGSRLQTSEDCLRWLTEVFELSSEPESVDALVAAISKKPGRVMVMHQIERAFLRVVGGFGALRTLLYVCNATSAKHFWVLMIHRPAWAYLSRLGPMMSKGGVRDVVDLDPLTGRQLRRLVLRRSEWAEVEVDFRRLAYTGAFGASPEVELERAMSSYFRLLAEGSNGCPAIALRLWALSLRVGAHGKADVVVTRELTPDPISDLSPEELFALAALRHQDQLTIEELAEVVNEPLDNVRVTVRELQHRGIVHASQRGVRIDDLQLMSVTQTLRRRHFLQWSV